MYIDKLEVYGSMHFVSNVKFKHATVDDFSVGVRWIKLVILSANFDPIQSGMVLLCFFFSCCCLFFFYFERESFRLAKSGLSGKCSSKVKIVLSEAIKKFPLYKCIQCKFAIIPEEGSFGQPRFSTLKAHSSFYRLLFLHSFGQ